jgi:signal transduction histidine kinase/ligand-binding sensor domain-containing protein
MKLLIRKIEQRILFAFILVTFTFSPSAFAQLSVNNLTWYTEKDGLPGTQVNKLIVDRFGYIWIGTINGLSRYDGYNFKRFYENPNDPGSIKGLVIWSLFEDSKGQIWVGSQPGKLNVYNPVTQSFRHYEFSELIESEVNVEIGINAITEDSSGRIYFGITSLYGEPIKNSLLYYDDTEDKVKTVVTPDSLNINNIISMTTDSRGSVWIKCWGGLYKINKTGAILSVTPKLNSQNTLLKNEIETQLISDSSGYVWGISNFARLFRLDIETNEMEIVAPVEAQENYLFNNLAMDAQGNIWMGTSRNLYVYNPKTKETKGIDDLTNKEYEYSAINTLALDSFGSVWIGTNSTGMYKYEERSVFKSFINNKQDPQSLTSGWVNNIHELRDDKLLVTTSGGGINIIDLKNNKIMALPYQKYLPGTHTIFGITEKSPGEIYFSANNGFFQFTYPDNQFKRISLQGIPPSALVLHFINDTQGYQWAFTNQGIYRKRTSEVAYQKLIIDFEPGDENRIKSTMRALESNKYGLWILTNDMLFLYDYKTNRISRMGNDKSKGDILGTQDINSLYEDPSGLVWVGTWQGGLSRYDVGSGKIKTYTINDGLPSMSIQSIIADEKNQSLWLSTFEGLSRFDIATEKFYNYSIDEGIQGQLFADGSFLKTKDGHFIFGGSNGFTIFKPDNLKKNSIPPKVFLTDLKLFNKSVLPGENSILSKPIYETKMITLEHDQNNISLEFIALHFSNPLKNKYSYKLENYDNDWREIANFQVAFYPNLPPGEYHFKVKAANNNGVWNEEGATLKILINKPWWNTAWAYGLYGVLLIMGMIGADRYFRYRVVQKERERARVRELEQAREIEKAYTELKATQAQLIQSEKMASLGELTAGIAHEIQNPLNFVNNFSEINSELIEELKAESEKPKADRNDKLEVELLNDIAENEKKIVHHGKRADAIVKGMLQHSRSSTGQKEPTDINALCDEYLRLSYHGYRAKDKSFNSRFETDFDPSLPKINVIQQDIGRVVLNLINNAFYAINEKVKSETSDVKHELSHVSPLTSHYLPLVTVSTKKLDDKIEVSVKDNGSGIPQKVLDKIFQPFFTTKPTGQGTGLGLSMSYDIVKAHGGELKVETKEGEGSEFIFTLPLT